MNALNQNYWKKRKKMILFIGFFFLGILSFSFLFYFMNTEDILLKKDLSCEFREKVYIEDFIEQVNGEVITNTLIDTNFVGKKKLKVQYRNHYGFFKIKEMEIEVLDVTQPTIVVSDPYIVEKGSISNLLDTIFCADDYDDDVRCKIEGSYDLEQIGSYPLTLTAVDHSGNQTSKDFTLKVVSKEKSNSSSNQNRKKTDFKVVYQKYKNANTMIGLDLSKWQQDVDFAKLKDQGVEFVMLKIGGQTKKQGEIQMDPKFLENIQNALFNDLKVGVYFYSYATSVEEARIQAKWVLKELKDYDITLPIAFDWENWSSYTSFHLSFHTLNQIAHAFIDEIEKANYEGMLYSSKYYLETIWYHEEYSIWLAYYTDHNDYLNNYLMWQVCNNGKIEGIDGFVDIDVWYSLNS